MRKVFLAVFVFVALFSAVSHASPTYTLTPWPYGVIAWVQTPSIEQQQFIDEATRAVQEVFAFWNLPVPEPALDWPTPTQTSSSQAWSNAELSAFTQTPSLPLGSMDRVAWDRLAARLTAVHDAYCKSNGTPFPLADSAEFLIVPAPTWGNGKALPLLIGLFPDTETMDRLSGNYMFSGGFGGVVGRYIPSRVEDIEKYIIFNLLSRMETIILSPQGNWQHTLRYVLAWWAYWLWGSNNQVNLFDLPKMISKGFADYTACALSGRDGWRSVAAIWSQEGDLTDVPRPLLDEVGTSIVDLLVQEKGKDGLLEMLVDPTTDWENVISLLTPAWRESLANVQLSAEDLPMYTAVLQDLALCRRMLAPVLPQEADDVVQRLYDGQGTMADIDRFWDLVSQTPPDPSEETWQALIARIPSFEIVQCHDSDPDIRMVRVRVQIKLDKYAEKRDWKSFYETFIEGLRTVIAHYGFQEVTDTAQ